MKPEYLKMMKMLDDGPHLCRGEDSERALTWMTKSLVSVIMDEPVFEGWLT